MAKLNVFIDGSWLFNACRADRALACTTEYSDKNFHLDFRRLNAALLKHVESEAKPKEQIELGKLILATSIFEIPEGVEQWPAEYPEKCTAEGIGRVRNGVFARERFIEGALTSGYGSEGIFRPRLRPYIVTSLGEGRYQEKQVDATIVALVVKYAITQPGDYHLLISGDKDMLPAIEVACPEFTVNVSVVTTHPDGYSAEQSQSAFTLFNYDFAISPFILDEHTDELLAGDFVYRCKQCSKVFSRAKSIPKSQRPLCNPCFKARPAKG